MAERNTFNAAPDSAFHRNRLTGRDLAMHFAEPAPDECGKCGVEIDARRRVDFTLQDGTRVCDSCFVKGTARPDRSAGYWAD
jgi:hypothetical protein